MKYTVAFSKISEPELRRIILGDGDHEPLTAITSVPPWAWNAAHEIAKRDNVRFARVLARAVRHYVISEGYNAPTYNNGKPSRLRGLVARIAGHFIR